jgi:phosphonopyruvate decarboxylase
MIDPLSFLAGLEEAGIAFATGVPDSLLKEFCAALSDRWAPPRHLIATHEGSAVGLAAGHYLATGRPGLVYLQNSGLGNLANPLASLADPQVSGIPMLLVIGWRGELREDGSQLADEPQHGKQGQITPAQLDLLGIPYEVLGPQSEADAAQPKALVARGLAEHRPVALLVRKGTFSPYPRPAPATAGHLTREAAITAILAVLPADCPVVATTGLASRELFALRRGLGQGHERDFLTVGAMGHAGQIAAGIALAKPYRKVICLDGDGALLMHLGALAVSAQCRNLLHIVIHNGVHDSVGGQPNQAAHLDLSRIAAACGYRHTAQARNTSGVVRQVTALLGADGSAFLEIRCRPGSRPDLGRPDLSPGQNRKDFMAFLREEP